VKTEDFDVDEGAVEKDMFDEWGNDDPYKGVADPNACFDGVCKATFDATKPETLNTADEMAFMPKTSAEDEFFADKEEVLKEDDLEEPEMDYDFTVPTNEAFDENMDPEDATFSTDEPAPTDPAAPAVPDPPTEPANPPAGTDPAVPKTQDDKYKIAEEATIKEDTTDPAEQKTLRVRKCKEQVNKFVGKMLEPPKFEEYGGQNKYTLVAKEYYEDEMMGGGSILKDKYLGNPDAAMTSPLKKRVFEITDALNTKAEAGE